MTPIDARAYLADVLDAWVHPRQIMFRTQADLEALAARLTEGAAAVETVKRVENDLAAARDAGAQEMLARIVADLRAASEKYWQDYYRHGGHASAAVALAQFADAFDNPERDDVCSACLHAPHVGRCESDAWRPISAVTGIEFGIGRCECVTITTGPQPDAAQVAEPAQGGRPSGAPRGFNERIG